MDFIFFIALVFFAVILLPLLAELVGALLMLAFGILGFFVSLLGGLLELFLGLMVGVFTIFVELIAVAGSLLYGLIAGIDGGVQGATQKIRRLWEEQPPQVRVTFCGLMLLPAIAVLAYAVKFWFGEPW